MQQQTHPPQQKQEKHHQAQVVHQAKVEHVEKPQKVTQNKKEQDNNAKPQLTQQQKTETNAQKKQQKPQKKEEKEKKHQQIDRWAQELPNQKQEEKTKLTEEQIQKLIHGFKASKGYQHIQKLNKQIHSLLNIATHQSQSLQINLGIGQGKGKTNLKYGIDLNNKSQQKFGINLQVKLKKKKQLRALIESQIKRALKLQGYHPYKLTTFNFAQTDKTLNIHINSPAFEQHIFKETIHLIETAYNKEAKPVHKIQGELSIKNSIRNDQASLQKKRFVKWFGEGFTSNTSIEGNSQVIHHYTSILEQFFPIFKIIRSGQINLKLKNISSIDKLFDKLGINEISEQTPTLSHFIAQIFKQHLHSQTLPWVDLIKRSIFFCSTIPNERVSIDVSVNLSHLHCSLSLSCQACKQLGDMANVNQVFS